MADRESTQFPMSIKSKYADLMRKFSENHKEQCRLGSVELPHMTRWIKEFPTGSQYAGTWAVLGMSGIGTYTFPNGVIYEGEFDDGMFHGSGELQYPTGEVIRAKFRRGNVVERKLMFADGLEYDEHDWLYCQGRDRRFTNEYELGLKPAGESYLTAEQPPRDIPPGYYDTGDGFYDPKTKVVYQADNLNSILRSPEEREQKWIVNNCRYAPVQQTGPRSDLYEEWMEPDLEAPDKPLPAAVSRACMHMFQEPEPEEEMDDSDTGILDHWQSALQDSVDLNSSQLHWRHLKFQPSNQIQLLTQMYRHLNEELHME